MKVSLTQKNKTFMRQIPLKVQLDDNATFDNFFVGDNLQVLQKLKQTAFTEEEFVFIWGARESGKTHLAQALCSECNSNNQNAAYIPLDEPMMQPQVLAGMSHMDLVCLDQISKVEGDATWETAIFDLYNNLKLAGKRLIIFSDSAPANSAVELPDLKSRLSAMEIYKLESLNDEEKVNLFKSRAENRGLEISDEVAKFIINRKSRSLTDLIDVLEKIDHSSMVLKRKVTIPLVKELFGL